MCPGFSPGGVGGSSSTSGNNGREFRERRLIRESDSQPIIIHVPITAPKATATSLSRATSPPPPHYLSSLAAAAAASGSPKKARKQVLKTGSGAPARAEIYKKTVRRPGETQDEEEEDEKDFDEYSNSDKKTELRFQGGGGGVKAKIQMKRRLQEEQVKVIPVPVVATRIPPHLSKYARNAPLSKVRHPLEENIFTSLLITLIAVGLALVVGIPVLFFTGGCLLLAISTRYSLFLLYGIYSYLRFICSNRGPSSDSSPSILPRDRLAFANDVRWLGCGSRKAQSILQTLLFFDGALDLGSLRHLILTRVVHAETQEGDLAYPRLMQKVTPFPAGFRWEMDESFDIANHVHPGPSWVKNEKEIQQYLGSLMTERLPGQRPLWEIRVFTGYGVAKDTLAILRVHQCLADGMSLVRILSHSLADQAQMHIPQRPHFAGLSFGFNVIRSMIVGPLTFGMWVLTTFSDKNLFSIPLRRGRKGWGGLGGVREWWRGWRQPGGDLESGSGTQPSDTTGEDPNLSLSSSGSSGKAVVGGGGRKLGKKVVLKKSKNLTGKKGRKSGGGRKNSCPHWNVVWSAPLSIPKVARVKQIMRSSLNDVLLAAAAGSVRKYLQKQGIPCPGDVKVGGVQLNNWDELTRAVN